MSSSTVRPVLFVDALISGATGAHLVITAPMLETWLDLPAPLLRYAGIILLPFAGGVVDWRRRGGLGSDPHSHHFVDWGQTVPDRNQRMSRDLLGQE